MKRRLSIIMAIIFSLTILTGCTTEESGKSAKGSNKENTDKKTTKINKDTTISEKVILDKDGIKVTAKSLEFNSSEVNIKLLIENNSSDDITIQTEDFSINDIMFEPFFSESVAAGKKANSSISLYQSDLKSAKVTTIKDIEFAINVFDSESWDDILLEEGITLTTNAKDYEQEYNTDGYLAVDKNGIKIYVLKLDDKESFWGADVTVYIENNSKQPITVQAEDVSINGFMIDPFFSADLMPGKKIYDELTFLESDLEDNDIEDITELELKFNIFNEKTWDDIFETDIIKINF